MTDATLVELATTTYIYGYPLLYNLDEIAKMPAGTATLADGAPVPYNTFFPARELLGPDAKFVSPNNDTLYLIAPLDLSGGPVALHVPDTADRYYVLQFVDAWTNNFAYIGRRATGTAAGDYLLVPAGFAGAAPAHTTTVEVPSDVAVIVGRIQVDGEADVPAVQRLQDAFTLTPVDPTATLAGIPAPDPTVADDLAFWERFRVALAAFPPAAGDAEFLAMAERLGLTGSSPLDPDPGVADALRAGEAAGRDTIEQLAGGTGGTSGWTSAMHYFDYNLDHLGLGTIDAAEWKIADRTTAYATRAVAARAGLWGNHGYEADYEIIWTDEAGDALAGSRAYEVTFTPEPPAGAFWSLTMYDVPAFYLVANPIDRYSIGSATPGLVRDDDGSVTVYLQATSPGADHEANWLPTPASGAFRPILRMYEPGAAIQDGTYTFPAIRRVPD